jgi:hypothetical protein
LLNLVELLLLLLLELLRLDLFSALLIVERVIADGDFLIDGVTTRSR